MTDSGPPAGGLAARRIAIEFGDAGSFDELLRSALGRGGGRGATLVAALDRGDLGVHIPSVDGPCWNAVPLFHLHRGEQPGAREWATTSGILEKLERYR